MTSAGNCNDGILILVSDPKCERHFSYGYIPPCRIDWPDDDLPQTITSLLCKRVYKPRIYNKIFCLRWRKVASVGLDIRWGHCHSNSCDRCCGRYEGIRRGFVVTEVVLVFNVFSRPKVTGVDISVVSLIGMELGAIFGLVVVVVSVLVMDASG